MRSSFASYAATFRESRRGLEEESIARIDRFQRRACHNLGILSRSFRIKDPNICCQGIIGEENQHAPVTQQQDCRQNQSGNIEERALEGFGDKIGPRSGPEKQTGTQDAVRYRQTRHHGFRTQRSTMEARDIKQYREQWTIDTRSRSRSVGHGLLVWLGEKLIGGISAPFSLIPRIGLLASPGSGARKAVKSVPEAASN